MEQLKNGTAGQICQILASFGQKVLKRGQTSTSRKAKIVILIALALTPTFFFIWPTDFTKVITICAVDAEGQVSSLIFYFIFYILYNNTNVHCTIKHECRLYLFFCRPKIRLCEIR